MSRLSWFQKIYWPRFAKPVAERELFAQLVRRRFPTILEIGVGDGQRMRRIARLSQLTEGTPSLRYIGVDEFESARDGRRHLSLKQAHQLAGQLGFKASLIPGDLQSALPRVAHKLGFSDLVIVDGGLDAKRPTEGFVGSWLNRLARADSTVLACAEPGGTLEIADLSQLDLPTRVAA